MEMTSYILYSTAFFEINVIGKLNKRKNHPQNPRTIFSSSSQITK